MLPEAEFKPSRRFGAVRILQLEDEPAYAELVRRNLGVLHNTEIRIECVGTLARAQQRLDAGGIDLVITDLNVPDSKGLDTLEGLTRVTDRPIIVLTGERAEGLLELALECGAYDVIEKDRIDQVQLERLVRLAAMHAKTFRSLRDSETRFRSLTELSSDWYWEQDEELRFTEVSGVGAHAGRGRERRADLGKTRWEIPAFEPLYGDWSEHRRQLERHEPFRDTVFRYLEADETRFVSVTGEPVFAPDGSFKGYRGVSKDVTDRVLAEEAARRVGRMYAALGAINEAIQRAASVEALFHKTCKVTVESGSFLRAIVRIADRSSGLLELAALAGRDSEALRTARIPIPPPGANEGSLAARVFRAGRPLVVRDVRTHPQAAELTPLAAFTPEVISAGAFPLHRGGVCIGVLLLHGTDTDSFDGEMTPLIERVASNLSFALESLDGEGRRVETEAALRDSEARFRSLVELSSDWFWEQDENFRFVEQIGDHLRNQAARPQRFVGLTRWEAHAASLTPEQWAAHRATLEAHLPFQDFEYQRISADGAPRWVSISGAPTFDAAGRFRGYRGVGRDITERKREESMVQLEHTVARCLADAGDAADALRAVIRAVCEAEHWECGRYFRVDEQAGRMDFSEAWGVQDPAIQSFLEASRGLSSLPGEGLIGHVWQTGEPVWAPEATKHPRARISHLYVTAGVRGGFFFPVKSAGKIIGVLAFSSREVREPEERVLQAIHVIGAQIGQFLQRKVAEEERVADEARLRESEARFRSLTGLSSDWYWEQDAAFRFTKISGAGAALMSNGGEAGGDYLGKTRMEIDDLQPVEGEWTDHDALLKRHKPFRDAVFRRRMADGSDRYMSVGGEPIFDAAGRFQGYRGIGKDVTVRMREDRLVRLEHSVARHLAEAASRSDALRRVMQGICESERWECGRYFTLDAAGAAMHFEQAWTADIPAMRRFAENSRSVTFRKGEGLIGLVWRDAEPLWIEDTTADPRVALKGLAAQAGLHGSLVFPVSFEGQVIGALAISSREVRKPDERLLQTMRVIGSQIGQFLRRKQGENAMREHGARLASIVDLQGQLAAEDLDVEGISRLLAEKAREVIGTGIAAVQYVDGEGFRYAAATGGGLHLLGVKTPLTGNFSGAVVASNRALYCEDTQSDPRVDPAAALRAGARSLIGAPLEHEGRVIGVLKVMSSEVRAFTAEQLGLLQLLAGIGGSAIQRRRWELEMRRFRMAMDASLDAIYLTDPVAMRFVDVNAAACRRTGYSRDELLAMGPYDVVKADRAQVRAEYDEVIAAGEQGIRLERQSVTRDGRNLWTELNRKVLSLGGEPLVVTVARDITERKLAEERQAAHARYQEKIAHFGESALGRRDASELLEDALRTVAEALPGCAVVYLEAQAEARTLVVRAVTGMPVGTHAAGGAYAATDSIALPMERGELAIVDRTEEAPPVLPFEWAREFRCAALVPVHGDSRSLGALCMLSGRPGACGVEESKFLVTAASVLSAGLRRIDSEGRLAFLAQFDALTGLPNRALLSDRFSQMIVQARRHDKPLGLLFIDLDDFKLVNDSLGHAGGDVLLKDAALRLQASVRPGDTVARISGDEFAVVLGDMARADDAAIVAQKIIDQLAVPFRVGGRELFVTASIGIAAFPADGADAEALLGAADAAMYRAKQAGRNGYQFFTADINQRTRARAQLGSELRRALERDEFVLAYQPKVDLRTGVACAAEALLRWRHPERGIVSPAEFIPVLEETGLIVHVGEWVLAQVCRDLKAWEAAGLPLVPVAVNLSARQFRHADLDDRIRSVVRQHAVDPRLIELEVTESQVMQDPEHANRVMRALSADGFRIAIDDFGTGYSSLSYLTRFPVAALKIDRSFVADVLEDPADATIVRTIVDMAHTLGFIVVAEGVETEAQAAFLRGLGCEQAQGYHFARPMPEAQLRALLATLQAGKPPAPARAPQPARSGTRRG